MRPVTTRSRDIHLAWQEVEEFVERLEMLLFRALQRIPTRSCVVNLFWTSKRTINSNSRVYMSLCNLCVLTPPLGYQTNNMLGVSILKMMCDLTIIQSMPDDTNALVPLSGENLALSLTDEHYDETTQW